MLCLIFRKPKNATVSNSLKSNVMICQCERAVSFSCLTFKSSNTNKKKFKIIFGTALSKIT